MRCVTPAHSLQMHDDHSVIGKSLFKKETKMEAFIGLKVNLSTGAIYTCHVTLSYMSCDSHVTLSYMYRRGWNN